MLNLTKSERRALLIIGIVLLVSVVFQWLQPRSEHAEVYDYSMQDSLFKALSEESFDVKQDSSLPVLPEHHDAKKSKPPEKKLHLKSININTATQKELQQLPYIGPVTANSIIEYRNEHGPFKSIKELDNVKRIGPKTIERIGPYVYLEESAKE